MSFRFLALVFSACASALVSRADPDLLIVGGGISGLSAAAEGARLGLRVTVVDRHSIYGGTAVLAYGVSIVGSPLQEQQGIKDSPELAIRDFVSWGGDPDAGWVKYYAEHSKSELFDWFASRGVKYEKLLKPNGNSVARFHLPRDGVVSLVQALYREIHDVGGVEFVMNTDVTGLVLENGRVTGVKVRNYRSEQTQTLLAKNVLLSTGGFQNNPELVRNFWPSRLDNTARILLGSGWDATGSGLELARSAGGTVGHLDRQWNYSPGIPLQDGPTGTRGVYVNSSGPIWVNAQGRRFINEEGDKRARLDALTRQTQARAWMIFDADCRSALEITHPVFNAEPTKSALMSRPGMQFQAGTIEELAVKAGLPPAALVATVTGYNEGRQSGFDEFGRRNHNTTEFIRKPPFFAVPIYPLTRKSMGGIQVDLACRVLTEQAQVVPGLYASGEATGFGGVNGKQSLEGTFIGTAILMGRVAARSLAAQIKPPDRPQAGQAIQEASVQALATAASGVSCLECHNLPLLTTDSRPGYRHFQSSHAVVLERKLTCVECHAAMAPFRPETHKTNKLAQVDSCIKCHSPAP